MSGLSNIRNAKDKLLIMPTWPVPLSSNFSLPTDSGLNNNIETLNMSESAKTFTNIDTALTDVPADADLSGKVHVTAQHPLPYWLVNVPRDQWPATCPGFLKDLPDKNIEILATPDAEFRRLNWDGVKDLVR